MSRFASVLVIAAALSVAALPAFADSFGWAVGGTVFTGTIVHTSDGGSTWSPQNSGTSDDLFGVSFADANNGWVVGRDGAILHTSNGGSTWSPQNSGTGYSLLGVGFVDANNGWAVGFSGIIVQTRDGGSTWSTQTSGTVNNLPGVSFVDANNGWAAGNSGAILHTSNGGGTWSPQISGTGSDLQGVSFVNTPSVSVSKTHTGTFTQGGIGEWDITMSNAAGSFATTGTTTMSDTLPAGYTVNNFSTTDVSWTCSGAGTQTATCTSTLAVKGGSSFPVIKIIVNIPAASLTSVTNTAKAFGRGDTTHTSLVTAASGSDTVSVIQVPASVTATAGTPQKTGTNTAFPTKLQATVRDAGSIGVPNVNVTFQAPGSGPSGSFGSPCSGVTCVVITDAMGVATAPTVTANSAPGLYTVTATVGSLAPASFALTNIAPPSFTKTFGASSINQGDTVSVSFAISNPNSISLTGLAFTDSLPIGLSIQNSNGLTNSCGGTVTAVPGTGTISLTAGTLGSTAASR
jgi:photosystem II stability/assembly factor-like uncharacterized protein